MALLASVPVTAGHWRPLAAGEIVVVAAGELVPSEILPLKTLRARHCDGLAGHP